MVSVIKRYCSVFIWSLAVFLLVGCFGKERRLTDVDKANKDKILLVGIGDDPESLDPHLASSVTAQNVLRSLFEGLVAPDPKTLEPVPAAAKSWEISEDRLTYTFFLRPEAKWSNGEEVSAEDFYFSIKRALTKEVAAPMANMFFVIKNAKEFYNGAIKDFAQVGVKVLGKKILQITLSKPVPYFLSLLMNPAWYPINAKALHQNGCFKSRNSPWKGPSTIITNGPFVVKNYKRGDVLELSKNDFYWDKKSVRLNGVRCFPIVDNATEERAFRNGQLHITENVPYSRLNHYYNKKSDCLKLHPYLGTSYYLINVNVKPLDDLRVRKALSLSVDRKLLAGTDKLKIKHKPAYNLVPSGTGVDYKPFYQVKEDVELARSLLAEAGYPGGKDFPGITLTFNNKEGQRYLAEAIQEMWKKNLNIDVELISQELKVFFQTRAKQDFQVARGNWIGDYNDPTTFLNLWLSTSNNNYAGWKNVEFDELMKKAEAARDMDTRFKLLAEAEQLLLQEMPLIPLHSSNTSHLVHESVIGWHGNILDWHPYHKLNLVEQND